jgi:hypothetical protein
MGNNIIVDVSEINSMIQRFNTLEATVRAETSVVNGTPTTSSNIKHFTKTVNIGTGNWNHHKVDGKYVRTLHLPFTGIGFTNTPNVQVTFVGQHPHLTVHVSDPTHSGCYINVVKTNGHDFGQHQLNHSVSVHATGR